MSELKWETWGPNQFWLETLDENNPRTIRVVQQDDGIWVGDIQNHYMSRGVWTSIGTKDPDSAKAAVITELLRRNDEERKALRLRRDDG